ncbi:hypothetical protein [Streptomyces sp. NPDC101165]|uniref:hypothetical protein n=1 Tax=Streptomyces sp. NPDC101165 TaxID=3366119 RepID=UPI003816B3F0
MAERWAFAFMSVFAARLVIFFAFFSFGVIHGYGFAFRNLFMFGESVYRAVEGGVVERGWGGVTVWYECAVLLVGAWLLVMAAIYIVRPLKPLTALVGDGTSESAVHRGTLRQIERQSRAVLVLYSHAAKCGRALSARGWVRDSLSRSACVMPLAESEIRQAWKKVRPATSTPLRHQRVELKNHAGRVIAALRAAAARVDADPEAGLRELGLMLVRIGDRLAEGRVGALLDEGELEGYEPVRDREVLRTVAAALLIAAAAVGVALLHLPAEVAGPLTTVTGIIVLVTLYKKARGAETVALLLGGK